MCRSGHALREAEIRRAPVWNTASSLPLILKSGSTSYISGPDGLELEQVTGSGSVYYYHADQIGNMRALTDATGTVQDTWAYDSYGNVTSSTGSVSNQFQFQGQLLDTTSGLSYMRARWYDSASAQFLSRDAISAFTRFAYTYAMDNPVGTSDPTGMFSIGACNTFCLGGLSGQMGDVAAEFSARAALASTVLAGASLIPGLAPVTLPASEILGDISTVSSVAAMGLHGTAIATGHNEYVTADAQDTAATAIGLMGLYQLRGLEMGLEDAPEALRFSKSVLLMLLGARGLALDPGLLVKLITAGSVSATAAGSFADDC